MTGFSKAAVPRVTSTIEAKDYKVLEYGAQYDPPYVVVEFTLQAVFEAVIDKYMGAIKEQLGVDIRKVNAKVVLGQLAWDDTMSIGFEKAEVEADAEKEAKP